MVDDLLQFRDFVWISGAIDRSPSGVWLFPVGVRLLCGLSFGEFVKSQAKRNSFSFVESLDLLPDGVELRAHGVGPWGMVALDVGLLLFLLYHGGLALAVRLVGFPASAAKPWKASALIAYPWIASCC